MRSRLIIAIVTTLLYELALAALALWALPRLGIYFPVYALVIAMLALGTWAVVTYRKGSQALTKKTVLGVPLLVGGTARVVSRLEPEGMVSIKGELWEARSTGERIEVGEEVVVVGQERLKLIVRRNDSDKTK